VTWDSTLDFKRRFLSINNGVVRLQKLVGGDNGGFNSCGTDAVDRDLPLMGVVKAHVDAAVDLGFQGPKFIDFGVAAPEGYRRAV
jgi:hypothetical protein